VRLAISGTSISPGIFESVALLGQEETLARIDATLARV
jgi:glutamyl-tRNA synthetase